MQNSTKRSIKNRKNKIRNITNPYLIIRFKFKKMISDIIIDQEDDLVLYKRETIEDAFNRYLTIKDIKIYKNKTINFYVQRGEEYIKINKIIPVIKSKIRIKKRILINILFFLFVSGFLVL